jgi:hypothetical protein
MPVVVTVALTFKPGLIESFWRDGLPRLQAETRGFPRRSMGEGSAHQDAFAEALFVDVFERAWKPARRASLGGAASETSNNSKPCWKDRLSSTSGPSI